MKEGWLEDDRENIAQYTRLCEIHGASHKALDWGSAGSQAKRFRVLAEIGLKNGERVLDVGCGLGDFYGWMQDNGLQGVSYKGIDITPALIEKARAKYPGQDFEVRNILESASGCEADYVFVSGIFAKRSRERAAFAKAMVAKIYACAAKGVAFNSLSASGVALSPGDKTLDPCEMIEYCRSLTPWLSLRMDYHGNDFTIYMRRERVP
jgi:SAM-dependent methyltransferase